MVPMQQTDNSSSGGYSQYTMTGNLDNIEHIQRMWRAKWPEFSWQTIPGNETSRCYQMFAPDISRVGYGAPNVTSSQCQVLAVMCPQQGIWIPVIEGTLNIEVTVTGCRGIVIEDGQKIDAEITIEPRIWFSPDTLNNTSGFIYWLCNFFKKHNYPFPSTKETAITLQAYGVDQNDKPVKSKALKISTGTDPNYPVPPFAWHYDEPDSYGEMATACAYLAVEIGEVNPTGNIVSDLFYLLVMEIFNLASGNLLQAQNVLSWNVWVQSPETVFTEEWTMHANYWRFSLDVNHRSPDGSGRNPQYINGTAFSPEKQLIAGTLNGFISKLQDKKPDIQDDSFVEEVIDKLTDFLSVADGWKAIFQ